MYYIYICVLYVLIKITCITFASIVHISNGFLCCVEYICTYIHVYSSYSFVGVFPHLNRVLLWYDTYIYGSIIEQPTTIIFPLVEIAIWLKELNEFIFCCLLLFLFGLVLYVCDTLERVYWFCCVICEIKLSWEH